LPTQGGLQLAPPSGVVWFRVFDENDVSFTVAMCV